MYIIYIMGDSPSMFPYIFTFNNKFIQILILGIFKYIQDNIFKFLKFSILLKEYLFSCGDTNLCGNHKRNVYQSHRNL